MMLSLYTKWVHTFIFMYIYMYIYREVLIFVTYGHNPGPPQAPSPPDHIAQPLWWGDLFPTDPPLLNAAHDQILTPAIRYTTPVPTCSDFAFG